MSAGRRALTGTQRLALAKAIESRVESMDAAGLLKLAATLKVAVPVPARVIGERDRRQSPPQSKQSEKVLQGRGVGPVIPTAEGSRLLDAITVDDESAGWIESDLLGAGELVQQLQISRGTLDNWRKAKKIIAFRKGLRNFLYPVRQFERTRPLGGLDLVASFFTSPEETWEWLVAPNRMTDGKPPIEKLRDGDVSMVTAAAEGAFDFA